MPGPAGHVARLLVVWQPTSKLPSIMVQTLLNFFTLKETVYSVTVHQNVCTVDELITELAKVRNDITWLQARFDVAMLSEER
ncbi:hypothetical protein AMTR_s00064p00137100 [Amborella trichopoda]|uniref:Uncharacterized protein n=1 Tax=Amborella trichopoda TaxID=13333 RepID=U5DH68_AMBTC|nr:hypothetical protein AMTR_s00064p00137100 [Amborella trichopoda]